MDDTLPTRREESPRHGVMTLLQLSELRYRRLFEGARDGILILDVDTLRIVDANPYIRELLGYSLEELLGKELWEIGLPKDRLESQRLNRELQVHRYVRYDDVPLESSDGGLREVEFVCNVYDEGDHAVIQCSIRDIGERKLREARREQLVLTEQGQADGALSDAQRQATLFRALHELAVAVAGMTDVATLARTIVEHAASLTGAEAGALYLVNAEHDALDPVVVRGLPTLSPQPPDGVLAHRIPLGSGATGRAFVQRAPLIVGDYASWDGAIPSMRAAGFETLVSIPLLFAERILGCLTLGFTAPHACDADMARGLQLLAAQVAPAFEAMHLVDVYARSELELSATLEQKVIDRTAQLEAAVRELEAFSYSVSHDLRSPLRSISSYSQILLKDHLDDLSADAQDCLQRVGKASQRMGVLIDDLLGFARLGRHALMQRMVAMGPLAHQVIDDLADERAGRDIDFEVADLPPCHGDPDLLRQVYANLIGNAVKYTRTRPIAHIRVGSRVDSGVVVYSVEDDGVGFDMRYADKLFGVFQRLHLSSEYEGTGVGLANVQRIIHRHGGRVWADATVGRGAAFFFTIGGPQSDAE